MGTLEVNIPPDILNDNDSSEGGVAVEGGTVRLKCHATGFPVPTVEWKREDGRHIMLRREGEPPKPGGVQFRSRYFNKTSRTLRVARSAKPCRCPFLGESCGFKNGGNGVC